MTRMILVAAFTLLGPVAPALAQAGMGDDQTPRLLSPQLRDPRNAQAVQNNIDTLKDLSEKIQKLTGGKININSPIDIGGLKSWGLQNPSVDIAGMLQTALNLMEAYNIIDPREDLIQPDLNPRGMPALPSRAVGDNNLSADERAAFLKLQRNIETARNFLEKNYVVLKQMDIKAKRLTDLASSAASMNGIAGLYWAKVQGDPNDPMNKNKAAFYAKYDTGQASGLKYLNDTLKQMGDFEMKNYGDRNWYVYFGLPYYNFMVTRYTRA